MGLLVIPFGIAVALLLADAYRKLAWFLLWASTAALAVGVLQSLMFSFRATSLWNLMTMVVMIAGGAGLMFKSLKGYQDDGPPRRQMGSDSQGDAVEQIRQELERLKARLDRH